MPQGPFYTALGKRIREARRAKKLTQEKLSYSVGLSRTSVTNIETGRQPIYAHTVVQIAQLLGVQVSDILPPPFVPEPAVAVQPQLQQLESTKRDWVIRIIGKQSETSGDHHGKNHGSTETGNRISERRQDKKRSSSR
jgi:transcriptional regulator with XRE-family HTH domain